MLNNQTCSSLQFCCYSDTSDYSEVSKVFKPSGYSFYSYTKYSVSTDDRNVVVLGFIASIVDIVNDTVISNCSAFLY